MKKQKHIFDELAATFSQERLNAYLNHPYCNNDKTKAVITYSWNIELSKALYPILQILEITLRNSLHNTITTYCGTEYWFELSFLDEKEKIQVWKTKTSLERLKKPTEACRVMAELSFGFWTSLFDIRYEHSQILWPRLLKPIFPFLPNKKRTRHYLSHELNRIRLLRNRVFHYEPIWHWKDLPYQYDSIINLINGLSATAPRYLCVFDRFSEVYSNVNKKIKLEIKVGELLRNK